MLGTLPAAFPVNGLAQMLVNGMIQKAQAAAVGTPLRNYVYFSTHGAPPRWVFDLFLTPYNESGFVPNAQVGTVGVAQGGRYTSVRYHTVKRQGLNVPPLWAIRVPAAGGGTRTIDPLLKDLLHIRGIDTSAPAHPAAQTRTFRPIGAAYTVTGLIADTAQGLPLKGINLGSVNYEFEGKSGSTPAVFPLQRKEKLGEMLLNPFASGAPEQFQQTKQSLSAEIDQAQGTLDAYAQSQHPGAESIRKSQADVEAIMSSAVARLLPKWEQIYKKYDSLCERSIREIRVPGVTDKPIGAAQRPANMAMYKYKDGGFATSPADLRDVFVPGKSHIRNMAEAFALAEFALTEKLSNSIVAHVGSFSDLKINNANFQYNVDEHQVGALMSLAVNTIWYGAYAACLAELIDELKAKRLFDDTVVHVGSEFGRSPNAAGDGSNHGYQGNSVAIYSGMVKGPIVIGNIMNNFNSASYPGTWGAAAPSVQGRKITPAHVANTLAAMLRLPEIVKLGPEHALINVNDSANLVTAKIGKADQK